MLLVHERKGSPGTWEVAWTWMPYFLAADRDLIKFVDRKMTEIVKSENVILTPTHLTWKVIDLIVEQRPLEGLREYLEGVMKVMPEGGWAS